MGKTGLIEKKTLLMNGMNPFDKWYSNNENFRMTIDKYYESNIEMIHSEKMKKDIVDMYINGSCLEKMQVLTVLGALNYYNLEV